MDSRMDTMLIEMDSRMDRDSVYSMEQKIVKGYYLGSLKG
jgi:hypothetical protein